MVDDFIEYLINCMRLNTVDKAGYIDDINEILTAIHKKSPIYQTCLLSKKDNGKNISMYILVINYCIDPNIASVYIMNNKSNSHNYAELYTAVLTNINDYKNVNIDTSIHYFVVDKFKNIEEFVDTIHIQNMNNLLVHNALYHRKHFMVH